jgi:hypothetical protein
VADIDNWYAGTAGGVDHLADLREHSLPVADVGEDPHLGVVDQYRGAGGLAHLGDRLRHGHPEGMLHAGIVPQPLALREVVGVNGGNHVRRERRAVLWSTHTVIDMAWPGRPPGRRSVPDFGPTAPTISHRRVEC